MPLTKFFENLLPRVNDWALAVMEPERRKIISEAQGDVLEIGFGTGLNLSLYGSIRSLTAIEPSDPMRHRGQERARSVPFPMRIEKGFAEKLPFADQSFDTVVATFVLCSVRDVDQVLREINRVLRPGGKLIALEHVRSDRPSLAKWQDRVTPVWKVMLGGCHPNRTFDGVPERVAGFKNLRLEHFTADQIKLASPHIRGVWQKPLAP